ncbi:MAG TPA: hypothetical protein VD814_01300 [Nocardioides sp.]|nr:hypothetical protein [Nocardioides sp.]
MQIYLTEAEDAVRRHHENDRHPRPHRPVLPRVRTRTRVASGLRRIADRLEQ